MGHPPACLFVVRHGFRLDAADKQWHLTSPTPYDPPLTYNGWQQAKSLGARIGALIRDLVSENEAAEVLSPEPLGKRKRKNYKVVVHSSPFLRCIQTAIAISAGLAQDSTPFEASRAAERPPPSPPVLSPRSRPTIITDGQDPAFPPARPVPIRKSVLRLDAFLGEWLSPGYFELITPPPESVMMLASAKADLLRREDYANYPNFSARAHSNSQGHLWSPGPGSISTGAIGSPDPFESTSSLSSSLQRTGSTSSQGGLSRTTSVSLSSDATGYVSPVPHWAANTNHNIPPGYVAHARDHCVDIDYQWDSMRSPLDWGDGGAFPEEWTSMHRRFRKGLQHLADWYATAENPTDMVTKTAARYARNSTTDDTGDPADDEDDVETEAIVILVSHGAGCNALIGAITHQPVLMDVAMASLTMAVRKPAAERSTDAKAAHHTSPPGWASPERKKGTTPVHQLYDLKIFANTDHLRSPPPTPSVTRTPSVASVVNGTRGRYPSFSTALNNFSLSDGSSRASSANAALSGFRRGGESSSFSTSKLAQNVTISSNSNGGASGGITVGSGVTSFATTKLSSLARTPSLGLWSPISARDDDAFFEDDDDDDGMLLNFSHEKETPVHSASLAATSSTARTPPGGSGGGQDARLPPSSTANSSAEGPRSEITSSPTDIAGPEDESSSDSSGAADTSASGLWGGGPRPPDDADRLRDVSCTKRRWTVNERGT